MINDLKFYLWSREIFDFNRLNFVLVVTTLFFVLGGNACSDDDQGNDTSSEPSQDAERDATDSGQDGNSSDTHIDGGNLLEAGEECPCVSPHPASVRCEVCEGQWCYTPRQGYVEPPYCTRPCDDNSDCTSLGNGWSCNGLEYCVQE